MLEIILAIIQSATEFLPVSSSGHLALFSNLFSQPDLFFFTTLHLASVFAVIIFVRKEIAQLLTFNPDARKLLAYLVVATIPAALIGFLFKGIIEKTFYSLFAIGIAFVFTGIVVYLTKFTDGSRGLDIKKAILIGLAQSIALFGGVSRSGMTISTALFLGVEKEKAMKFSFLLFIPLSLGAFILEVKDGFYLSANLVLSFFVCLLASLLFLKILTFVVKRDKFWVFSIYCFVIGFISMGLYFFKK
ncbi:MAG: undecaprenyl-diphosphate phosphatase [Candidatus Omnitrophota bacterium]